MELKQQQPRPRTSKFWPSNVFYGWAIVLTGLVASFGMVPVFGPVLGVFIKPIEQELGWSRATISMAFTIGSLTGTLSTFAFGRLIDRYGSRVMVVVAGGIISGSMIVLAYMQEPWQFWIAFGAGRGAAIAGIHVAVTVTIANWFIKRRGRAVALRGIGQRAGQSLVPLLIIAIISVASWRAAFLALACFTAITIILPGALYLRRRPEDIGLQPDGMLQTTKSTDISPKIGRFSRAAHDYSWTLAEARRMRTFWILVLFTAMERFCLGSINLHMVVSFQDRGLSDVLAVSVLSIFAATSALTGLPWGLLLERIHVRYGAMLVSILLAMSMLIIMTAEDYPSAIAFGLLFG